MLVLMKNNYSLKYSMDALCMFIFLTEVLIPSIKGCWVVVLPSGMSGDIVFD